MDKNISKISITLTAHAPWLDSPVSTDELRALSETAKRLNTWIARASILPPSPQEERAAQVELWTYQARVIGISPDVIERMLFIAERVGPMTLLPNEQVRDATWQSMKERAAMGKPPIPTDESPLVWTWSVWHIMYIPSPDTTTLPSFLSLADALTRARDDSFTR